MGNYFLAICFSFCLLACQANQAVLVQPVTNQPDSLITLKLINAFKASDASLSDSVITLKLPNFEVLAEQSITPAGGLDRVGDRTVDLAYHTRYLYNASGQPAGYCSSPLSKDQQRDGTYYEYKDNRIYRVYTMTYEFEMAKDFIYFVDELRYTANQVTKVYNYYLDLRKGTATFNTITDLAYDTQGHLISIRDERPGTAYPTFTWENDNLKTREEFNGDGTPAGIVYTYKHDNKANPLKAFELPYQHISSNNITSEKVSYAGTSLVYQTDYQLTYDSKDHLQSSLMVFLGQSGQKNPTYLYTYK